MRAALDASIGLLSAEERDVFVRASFFQGGFTARSLGHLCSGLPHIEALDTLAERSLVSMGGLEVARFTMLELVRAYAQSQAPADLQNECGWLHADYFVTFAEHAEMGDLDQEYTNLIVALRWLHANDFGERALQLAVSITPYWESKGRAREGLNWFAELFKLSHPETRLAVHARAQACAGHLAWLLGDYEWGASQFEAALDGFSGINDDLHVLEARFSLQMEAHRVGDYERAIELLKKNLELAERLGDRSAIARCWLAMGNASVEQLRWDDARTEYELSLRYAREAENRDRIGQALNNLGNLAVLSGQVESGRRLLNEAIQVFREVDHHWHMSMALIAMSKLDLLCGEWGQSLQNLIQAIQLSPEENPVIWRVALHAGFVMNAAGRFEPAAQFFGFTERSLESMSRGNHPVELAPYEQNLEKLRDNLPPERLQEFWSLGRTLTTQEATSLLTSAAAAICSKATER